MCPALSWCRASGAEQGRQGIYSPRSCSQGGNKTQVRWQFQYRDEGNVGEGTSYGGNTTEGHLS